jgi:heptaprenylglyceryl phosphate synthase
MAETKHNYADNVKKYATNVDEDAIAGIVKHLGIALQSRDASFVASKDKEEMARVRDHFLKKKLGLTHSDAELDAAVKAVTTRMKAERDKHRVTVYYLLAEKFEKLPLFHSKPKKAAKAAKG